MKQQITKAHVRKYVEEKKKKFKMECKHVNIRLAYETIDEENRIVCSRTGKLELIKAKIFCNVKRGTNEIAQEGQH